MMHFLLALLLPVAVSASAIGNVEARAPKKTTTTTPFCSKVTSLINAAHAQSLADVYCTAVLGITTSTVTTTTTVQSGLTTTSTTVTDTTQTENTVTTVTDGSTTVTTFDPSYTCLASPNNKRAAKPKPTKPGCFSSFTLSAQITSACSCLSLTTPTTTATSTTGTPGTTVQTVHTTAVTTSTSTVTVQSTVYPSAFLMYDPNNENYAESGYVTFPNGDRPELVLFETGSSDAGLFYLDDSCILHDFFGEEIYYESGSAVMVSSAPSGYSPVVCSINGDTYQLDCGASDSTCSYSDDGRTAGYVWYLGATSSDSGCSSFSNIAVPRAV